MIYLDNSATTYPKPTSVQNAVSVAFKEYGANPGRSGHAMSVGSGREVVNCRKTAAAMFGIDDPNSVVFTLNCTHAANIVLKGLLKPGDHVIVSCLEHNAVMRPLKKLSETGVSYSIAQIFVNNIEQTVDSFRKLINPKTKLIVCMHASNVWGIRLPIEKIAAMAKIHGVSIMVDAAQSAGVLPIDMKKMDIDYLCLAGHKGLYGPMGTGMLITSKGKDLDTLVEGGTGTDSLKLCQPKEMPQRFESGTPNMVGIVGLRAGMNFVKSKGIQNILTHEMRLITYLYDKLRSISGVIFYTPRPDIYNFVPVLSFNLKGYLSDKVGKILDSHGVEVRTGLQCSPAAHEFYGTASVGVVRVSPSIFTTSSEIDRAVEIIKTISKRF